MDDDLTPDEEAALLVALLRWRTPDSPPLPARPAPGMDMGHLVLDGCTRNDLTEVDHARSHR